MPRFVTTKPKSFWLATFACGISLLIGIPGVLITNATENHVLHVILFVSIVGLWLVSVVFLIAYFAKQASGRYTDIESKSLKDQVW